MGKPEVARGMGPAPVRLVLAGFAAVYFVLLVRHPDPVGWIAPVAYFTECTSLFSEPDKVASEYRLEGWSCERRRWEPIDPRVYFPMRADDKEARFQRLAHFYKRERRVLEALDDYVVAHHGEQPDGLEGPIGGVQLFQIERKIPPPGADVERYEYTPLAATPDGAKREDLFFASTRRRHMRCGGATPAADAPAADPWASP